MESRSKPASSGSLVSVTEELKLLQARLEEAEGRCVRIDKLKAREAARARKQLDEARGEFSRIRLRLLRLLDPLAIADDKAERVRQAISQRCRYPSAEATSGILGLLEALETTPSVEVPGESRNLAERLSAAMSASGDNKKSAAGKMGIASKTLNRLLLGESTKPVKQAAARRYISNVLGDG